MTLQQFTNILLEKGIVPRRRNKICHSTPPRSPRPCSKRSGLNDDENKPLAPAQETTKGNQ